MENMIYVGFWLLLKRLSEIVEEYRSLGKVNHSMWLNYGADYEETLNVCKSVANGKPYYSKRDATLYDSMEFVYWILYGACMSQDASELNADIPEHRELYLHWLTKMYKKHLYISTFEETAQEIFGYDAQFILKHIAEEKALNTWRKIQDLKEKYPDDDNTLQVLNSIGKEVNELSKML